MMVLLDSPVAHQADLRLRLGKALRDDGLKKAMLGSQPKWMELFEQRMALLSLA